MIVEEKETKSLEITELIECVLHAMRSTKGNGNIENVINLATNFSIKKSISPNHLFRISASYESNKSYDLAYIFARSAANISTGNLKATAHYNAGTFSVLMGHKDEAERQYKLALASDPNITGAHINYGVILREMGKREEAEEQFKLAIKLDPENVTAHFDYGVLLK